MSRIRHAEKIRQAAYFLGAGLINTLFGYALFGILIYFSILPSVAVVVSTLVGILFNFGSIGTIFGSRNYRLLPRFVAVYAALLTCNLVLLHALMAAGTPTLVAQAFAVALLAPCSFLAMRRLVFGLPSSSQETCA